MWLQNLTDKLKLPWSKGKKQNKTKNPTLPRAKVKSKLVSSMRSQITSVAQLSEACGKGKVQQESPSPLHLLLSFPSPFAPRPIS